MAMFRRRRWVAASTRNQRHTSPAPTGDWSDARPAFSRGAIAAELCFGKAAASRRTPIVAFSSRGLCTAAQTSSRTGVAGNMKATRQPKVRAQPTRGANSCGSAAGCHRFSWRRTCSPCCGSRLNRARLYVETAYAAFQRPMVLPSGSCIQAKVPAGMVTGPTSVLPPSALAFSR